MFLNIWEKQILQIMLTLKLQYGFYEPGEFTREEQVSLERLLEIFDECTGIIQFRRSFTIKRPQIGFYLQNDENYLKVRHFSRDVFSVEYCNESDPIVYFGKFYLKSIHHILFHFANRNFEALSKKIPPGTEKKSSFVKTFKKLNFTYTYRYLGYIPLFFSLLLFAPSIVLLLNETFTEPFDLFKLGPAFFLMIILGVPLILTISLDINHYKHSKEKAITISSGSPVIIIKNGNNELVINKSEIREICFIRSSAWRAPFGFYEYSRIILNNGSKIDISDMILGFFKISRKANRIPTRNLEEFLPYVKYNLPPQASV